MLSTILRYFLTPLPDLPEKRKKLKKSLQYDAFLTQRAKQLLTIEAPLLAERVMVFWNSRLRTTAGLASYHRSEVILHPALREISEEEVDKTLRHELAHLLAKERSGRKRIAPHGKEWRQACADLGIPNESRTHQLPFARSQQQRKFFYCCPSCGTILSRVRQPKRKIACVACCRKYAAGKYDERFRYEVFSPIVRGK